MGVLKARTRAVLIRISQDEYEHLQSDVVASGSRSMSELARSRVLRAIGEPTLADMGQKLGKLEAAVKRLTQVVNRQPTKGNRTL